MISSSLLCQQYLQRLYYSTASIQEKKPDSVATVYGEILASSIDKLLKKISITEKDIFFDLGSGLGKAAIQVYMQSLAKEVCGIELLPELYHQAIQAKNQFQQELPGFFDDKRKLNFELGSFLDISFANATIVFINSTCFSQTLLANIGSLINSIPTIQSVLTLRPIQNLKTLRFQRAIRIDCSWDAALCYVYAKEIK